MSMESETTPSRHQPRWMTIVGWILTVLPSILLLMGAAMNLSHSEMALEGLRQYGYPENVMIPLGIAALLGTLLYLLPQTCVLGAILLTGYLGGATATHVRAGEPFIVAVAFGVVIWLALLLRDPRVRSLLPIRRAVRER